MTDSAETRSVDTPGESTLRATDTLDIAVVGAGMAGMMAALFLARDGHRVTVFERDDNELPDSADEAFEHWNRAGVAHARQSHALLARLRSILRRHAPDVLEELQRNGATELTLDRLLPPSIQDRSPREGDDELVLLCCRRLTIEWVLRRAVEQQDGVEWRSGVAIDGLVADGTEVTGVRLAGGSQENSDLVVLAGGRNMPVIEWIAELGGDIRPTEEHSESGILYLSRFYRLNEGCELPVLNERGIGGDLGYMAFAGFYGDNRTFSITVGLPTGDRELLALRDEAAWEAAVSQFAPLKPWTEPGLAEPITGVEVMARLQNRLRRFVVDGAPVATGVAVIGDAAIATNPWYGKGCSTAGIAAEALAVAVREHGRDKNAVAHALHDALVEAVEPHYELSLRQDNDRIKLHTALHEGAEPDVTASATRDFIVNGLIPATRSDPDVFRTFFRSFNMLDAPDRLMADPAVLGAAQAAHASKDEREPDPPAGPPRDELLALMAAAG